MPDAPAPRYEARPFLACIGTVARAPSSARSVPVPSDAPRLPRPEPALEPAIAGPGHPPSSCPPARRRAQPLDLPRARSQVRRRSSPSKVSTGPSAVPSRGSRTRTAVPRRHRPKGRAPCRRLEHGAGTLGPPHRPLATAQPPGHVHAVVGVPDRGVELGQEVPLARDGQSPGRTHRRTNRVSNVSEPVADNSPLRSRSLPVRSTIPNEKRRCIPTATQARI